MKITNFKEYAKKAKRTILAKTALLVGLTVPLASCGKPVDKETNKLSETKKIVAIEDTNSTEILEGATIEEVEVTTNEKGDSVKITEAKTEDGETIKITETTNEKGETVKVTEQTNEKGETVKITEKTNEKGETVKITEKKDENGEVIEHIETATVEKTTGGKTNTVTTSKITNKTTTTKLKGKTTVQTTRVTTKPVVTAVKTQPVQTQPKQTQPPVTQPPVTQPIVTQPPTMELEIVDNPKTNFTKYDLLNQDTRIAAQAFEELSDELCQELFNGYRVAGDFGITSGYEQSRILLAALNYNYNGGINPKVLAYDEALGNLSREDIIKYSMCIDLPQEQHLYGSRVDFNKYVLDENFANEIEDITNKYIDWADNGNYGPLDDKLNNYFANNRTDNIEAIKNYIEFYYMSRLDSETMGNYSDDFEKQLYQDRVITPIYNSYEPYKGHSYTR